MRLAGVTLSLTEYLVSINIEKLQEGVYLATSENLQGLVAQGRTIAETIEIAQDVARKLIESCIEKGYPLPTDGPISYKSDSDMSRDEMIRGVMKISAMSLPEEPHKYYSSHHTCTKT